MGPYYQFETILADGNKATVVINVGKITGVESNPDSGTIVVDGSIIYKCNRNAGIQLQNLLMDDGEPEHV